MKKRIFIFSIIFVLLLVGIYFGFLFSKDCPDMECFNQELTKCNKASYIKETEDASWKYSIKGKSGERCEIKVTLLQLKEGGTSMSSLQGKSMNCYLPIGVVASPEENIKNCHGLLKEEMQEMIINNLHNFIIDNLGEIKEELGNAI